MADTGSKKMVIFYILEILKKYSDGEHKLSQKDIENVLKGRYGIIADRKSVKSNIMSLIEFGYPINYSDKVRVTPNKKTGIMEENVIMYDFYMEHDFDKSELRLMIDSLFTTTNVPNAPCKDIISKLENQSSEYFKSHVKHIASMPEHKNDNKQIFYTINVVDEAISQGCKISFKYGEYGSDLKLRARKGEDGKDKVYVASPYQMVVKDGHYYLILNSDSFDNAAHYRMDRILDVKVLDEKARPFKTLVGSNGLPLNLKSYMEEHIYMYVGDSDRATLRVNKRMISDMVDIFGKEIKFSNETESNVDVVVKANSESVLHIAQRYAPDVVILEPQELRDEIVKRLKRGVDGYE